MKKTVGKSIQINKLSKRRRTVYAAITVALPFLLVVVLELSLRLIGVGTDLSLFRTELVSGKKYLIMNPEVKGRYFPRLDFSPTTSMDFFPEKKPFGTYRVFCLGGSTTVGFPYGYVGSFVSFLRERLRLLFPGKSIEVINLGMTATNSYTVADIMRELPSYAPDLVVVYDGHNEFYGALGSASHESIGGARWITRLYLRLIRFRSFQVMRTLYTATVGLFGRTTAQSDEGMTMMEALAKGQYVRFGSSDYLRAENIFRGNLYEIADIAREHRIPLIFGTQASNLRDLPPFVSEFPPDVSPEMRMQFHQSYNNGLTAELNGDFRGALTFLQHAAAIDSLRADVRFAIARCLDSLGQYHDAHRSYLRARDLDELRFRTSTDFNDVIRKMNDDTLVFVADLENAFFDSSPDSITGNSLILEHLHPNLRGAFLMAKEYGKVMASAGLLGRRGEWARQDTLTDESLWSRHPLSPVDDSCASYRVDIVTSHWPFVRMKPARPTKPPSDPIAAIALRASRAEMSWEQMHVEAAEFYESHGNLESAANEYRVIISQIPFSVSPYLRLGKILAATKDLPNAAKVFAESIQIEPTFYGTKMLGTIKAMNGDYSAAVATLNEAIRLAGSPAERQEAGRLLDAVQSKIVSH